MCTWIWTLSIKTWLIFHTWQHCWFHGITLQKTKRFQIILAGTMCTFPISFYVCVCMRECVWVSVSSLTVIFGFSGATRFVFCKKMIPEYWTFFMSPPLYFLSIQDWNQICFIGVSSIFSWYNLSLKLHNFLQTAGLIYKAAWQTAQRVNKPLFIQWRTLMPCRRASIWATLELLLNNKVKLLSCCVIIALLLLFHSDKF